MARRFDGYYRAKRLDNLGDPDWHNRRWEDVDRRLHARELDSGAIEGAVERLEAVALARLNDTFSPLIAQAQNQLADVGVSFSGQSLSTHTIGIGAKTFMITEAYRVGLVVVDFVSIRPTGVTDAAMICSVVSYDRTTGALLVEPQEGYTTGTGTYSDWQIRVSVTPNLDTYSREEVDGEIDEAVGQMNAALLAVVDGAPDGLNTLNKLATAIGGVAGQQAVGQTQTLLRTNNLSDLFSAATARVNIGLGNVNNTSDSTKPVSAPQQAAINAVVAATLPVGTTMIFFQAAVPPGWIRNTSHHDKTIRVLNSAGGTSGGVQAWSTVFGRTTVDNTTLDGNTLPSHAHGLADPGHAHGVADYNHIHGIGDPTHLHGGGLTVAWVSGAAIGEYYGPMPQGGNTDGAYTGIYMDYRAANIAIYGAGTGQGVYGAGGSAPHTHGIDLRCQYIDVIIGVKA